MALTTLNTRTTRNGVSLLIVLAMVLGFMTVGAGAADAQTLKIGVRESDTHFARCTPSGSTGTLTITSTFYGPADQRVAYRLHIWQQNSNGRWVKLYTTPSWEFTTVQSNGTVWPRSVWTVQGNAYFWVSVESYRAVNGSWTNYRHQNAQHETFYNGRTYGIGCRT